MSRRPRGAYIGGHTVIGPSSGWFSRSRRKKNRAQKGNLRAAQIAEQEQARRLAQETRKLADAERRQAKLLRREEERQRQAAAAAKKAAKRAAQNTPEVRAKREEMAAARRLEIERKMAKVVIIKRPLPRRLTKPQQR